MLVCVRSLFVTCAVTCQGGVTYDICMEDMQCCVSVAVDDMCGSYMRLCTTCSQTHTHLHTDTTHTHTHTHTHTSGVQRDACMQPRQECIMQRFVSSLFAKLMYHVMHDSKRTLICMRASASSHAHMCMQRYDRAHGESEIS